MRFACVLVCVLPAAAASAASDEGEVAPGHYATQPGWGDLQVSAEHGRRRFALSAIGANAHVCDLAGTIVGRVATTDAEAGDARCVVDIGASGDRLGLKARTFEACRQYCGLRASFEGDYLRLPAGCEPTRRKAREQAYLDDYRARRYPQALAKMEALEAECGGFFDWLEKDAFANDKAITQYHLGRRDACLRTLDGTRFADTRNEAQLREAFWPAPTDWDSYLPIARASWHTRALCAAAADGAWR